MSLPYKITPEQWREATKPKRNKYGVAKPEDRTWNGVLYDSKREMIVAQGFELLLQSGVLKRLDRQVRYPILVNKTLICTYVADFRLIYADGRQEICEVKGHPTDVWKLKHKLMTVLYPKVPIRIVK